MPDPDLAFSETGVRRLGRRRAPVGLAPSEQLAPSGMRTTFGEHSLVRLEVFYETARVGGRRSAAASIRSGRTAAPGASEALSDPSKSSLTEHAVSYLVRNDQLVHEVPRRDDELDDWVEGLHRATHYVSDMRRRASRLTLDDGAIPVVRIDDPFGRWAAAAFELGGDRVTIAGTPTFLDRAFTTSR